jgi:hypothetical protein
VVQILCLFLVLGTSPPERTIAWLPQAARLDVSIPDWPYASSDPRIAASGDRIFAVWRTFRYHGDPDEIPETDVYFSSSHNGGLSWFSLPIRLNSAPSKGHIADPQLACCGDDVFVAWQEARSGTYVVYFIHSPDAGLTWPEPPVRINHGRRAASNPQLACSDECVVLAWVRQKDIFAERSLDAGITWSGRNIRIDTGDARGSALSTAHKIGCSGGRVFAVWSDRRNGPWDNVYLNGSWDGGESWLSSAIPLENDISSGIQLLTPNLAVCGDRIAAVWTDNYPELPDINRIRLNLSLDGGIQWKGEKNLLLKGQQPRVAVVDQTVHITSLRRNVTQEIEGVWYCHGLIPEDVWSEPKRISFDSEYQADFLGPMICSSGNRVYVAWGYTPDHLDHGIDIFCNLSTDHGRTWLDDPVRVDTGDPSWSYDSTALQIACSGKRVHAVWADMRPGLEGIYFNTGLVEVPPATLTIGAGPGGTTLPPPGLHTFERGSDVILTAEPDALYEFSGWGGDLDSADPSIRLELDRDTSVTAEFARILHPPLDLTAENRINRSLFFQETIHVLKWSPNPLNVGVTGYRIYRKQTGSRILLGESAAGVDRFLCRNAEPGISVTYEVTAVDEGGREGIPAVVGLDRPQISSLSRAIVQ